MDVKEKLVELLFKCAPQNTKTELRGEKITITISQGNIADYLIASGVTVRERGRWILKETCGANTEKYHCSVCDKIPRSLNMEDFCPNCGAKMDGEK